MTKEGDSIQEILANKTESLVLYAKGEAPIKRPGKYITLGWEQLESEPELLNSLVRCYQEVYGSDEKGLDGNVLWGEGGMCPGEGWKTVIPLKQLRQLQQEGSAKCQSCGSDLVECYPPEQLAQKIKHELTSGENPFITLMLGDEEMSVVGFAWGAVLKSPQEVGQRLIEARYSENPDLGEQIVSPLVTALEEDGVGSVVFFDEFAVLEKSRKEGFDPVRYLARDGFEIGLEADGVSKVIFWTKETSRIYPITRAFGFDPVGEVGGLTFMLNRDVVPTLKMLQNLERPELESYLAAVLRSRV